MREKFVERGKKKLEVIFLLKKYFQEEEGKNYFYGFSYFLTSGFYLSFFQFSFYYNENVIIKKVSLQCYCLFNFENFSSSLSYMY